MRHVASAERIARTWLKAGTDLLSAASTDRGIRALGELSNASAGPGKAVRFSNTATAAAAAHPIRCLRPLTFHSMWLLLVDCAWVGFLVTCWACRGDGSLPLLLLLQMLLQVGASWLL